MIESSSYGLHLNRWNIELVISVLLNDDEGLKHDHRHDKLKRIICNENAVNLVEGRVTTIWVKFDGSYNYYEMAVFFFLNLLNINLERQWAFICVDDENLYVWNSKICVMENVK